MMDFEKIYDLYFRDVYLFTISLCGNESVAEEVTQEAFFKALKSIDKFDGSKDIRAWLFTIARNTYFSHYKKSKRLIHNHVKAYEEVPDIGVNLIEGLTKEEDNFMIHQFIHQMAEPYKEVFSLRVFGELPFLDIGNLFGKSAGWARVTFYRARKQIMVYMEGINDEEN